jgi:phosphoglycerate kinase
MKDATMQLSKLSIEDVPIRGKRVFVRVDFNVPLDQQGHVTDETRIRSSLPTIQRAIAGGAKIILASHLGRPGGKVEPRYSLRPVASCLSELLGKHVAMADDCVGPAVEAQVGLMHEGDVLLLENLRFHVEEEKNDSAFAQQLGRLADVYVNDAFGTAHRAHASTAGMTQFVPVAVAGLLMQAELSQLGQLLEAPERPCVAILGGAKVSDKIGLILNLLPKLNQILIGGGMAYTFLMAQGLAVGNSLVEADKVDAAGEILARATALGVSIRLPEDHVIVERLEESATTRVVPQAGIPAGWMGVDIGPRTVEDFTTAIGEARTVVWNGPMGVFEIAPFAQGTTAVALAVASAKAATIVGGGDSVAAVNQAGVADRITHISTGGGAFLELLEGRELPGVTALTDRPGTGT